MNKPNFARRSLVLAVSLLLAAAFSPTSLAASEPPRVISTIELGPNPDATAFALAVNPRRNKTYVTPGFEPLGCESHIVSVIDNATNTVLAPITTGLSPFGVAVNPKTNKIYVTNIGGGTCTDETSNTVSVIDGWTDTVDKTITLDGFGPAFVAVNPKTTRSTSQPTAAVVPLTTGSPSSMARQTRS
jgi:YVTN family beta-propeller protein